MLLFVDITATDTVSRSVQIYIKSPIKIQKKYLPSAKSLSIVEEDGINYLCFIETNEKLTYMEFLDIMSSLEEVYINVNGSILIKPLIITSNGDYGTVIYNGGFTFVNNKPELSTYVAYTMEYADYL